MENTYRSGYTTGYHDGWLDHQKGKIYDAENNMEPSTLTLETIYESLNSMNEKMEKILNVMEN